MMLTQTGNQKLPNYRVTDNKMYWDKIDEKHKSRFNSNFVLCEEMYEISYIIQAILEFYPKLPRERITNAIYKSLREIPHPRLRTQFWQAVSEKLEIY
ncbi:MAG: hypothetical protein NTY74_13770 [Ignavibacteriae bacterium]|nr:hypothetical protein [Ignavibacteriota bacterium]